MSVVFRDFLKEVKPIKFREPLAETLGVFKEEGALLEYTFVDVVKMEKVKSWLEDVKINTLTVLIMQVPCCMGLLGLAEQAAQSSKRKVSIKSIIVSLQGEILSEQWAAIYRGLGKRLCARLLDIMLLQFCHFASSHPFLCRGAGLAPRRRHQRF